MRLQNFLSNAGITSRRKIIDELNEGHIKINGQVVRIPSYPVFPESDTITYKDKPVKLTEKRHYLFHKPRGVITTVKDTHGRKTVMDFFKGEGARLFPVGRLDRETTGLLLMTNDGELANQLMHPRYGVQKIYEVIVSRLIKPEEIKQLEAGVMIEGEKTNPCKVQVINRQFGKIKLEVTLHEGRKRQIRLMFKSIGAYVIRLHRKQYGPLHLGSLRPGSKRLLKPEELEQLQNAIEHPSRA